MLFNLLLNLRTNHFSQFITFHLEHLHLISIFLLVLVLPGDGGIMRLLYVIGCMFLFLLVGFDCTCLRPLIPFGTARTPCRHIISYRFVSDGLCWHIFCSKIGCRSFSVSFVLIFSNGYPEHRAWHIFNKRNHDVESHVQFSRNRKKEHET